MNQELIASKIDLLQEQIDNLEKSGFFTEKEMDRFAFPLRAELALLKIAIPFQYGMSDEEYQEGKKLHDAIFAPIKAMNIEVIDAEILTPNHQEA